MVKKFGFAVGLLGRVDVIQEMIYRLCRRTLYPYLKRLMCHPIGQLDHRMKNLDLGPRLARAWTYRVL